jgi:hypothetical protein
LSHSYSHHPLCKAKVSLHLVFSNTKKHVASPSRFSFFGLGFSFIGLGLFNLVGLKWDDSIPPDDQLRYVSVDRISTPHNLKAAKRFTRATKDLSSEPDSRSRHDINQVQLAKPNRLHTVGATHKKSYDGKMLSWATCLAVF